MDAIRDLPGIRLYGPPAGPGRSGVVSTTLTGMEGAQTAMIMNNSFDIAVRAGPHCAPDAHRTLGTLAAGGTIRISLGYFSTEEDIRSCVRALEALTGA